MPIGSAQRHSFLPRSTCGCNKHKGNPMRWSRTPSGCETTLAHRDRSGFRTAAFGVIGAAVGARMTIAAAKNILRIGGRLNRYTANLTRCCILFSPSIHSAVRVFRAQAPCLPNFLSAIKPAHRDQAGVRILTHCNGKESVRNPSMAAVSLVRFRVPLPSFVVVDGKLLPATAGVNRILRDHRARKFLPME